jgi:hypothetical protein
MTYGACGTNEGEENAQRVLVGKSEEKRPLKNLSINGRIY